MKWIPCIQCSSNKANELLARSSVYMSNKRYSSAAYVDSKGGYTRCCDFSVGHTVIYVPKGF